MRKSNQLKLYMLFYLCSLVYFVKAEGTKQLAPNPSDRVFLYSNVEAYGNFAQFGSADAQRLYVHISDPDKEQLFLGFSQAVTRGHYPCEGSEIPIYFRIVGPNGVVVYPNRGNTNGQLLDASNVNITSKSQAINGPKQIVGEGGYDAFVFDPIGFIPGDYYIEFSRNENSPSLDQYIAIEWWDITVATKEATPSAIDGRVYSKNWALMSPSVSCGEDPIYGWFDKPFNGRFYVYTDQKIVTKADFNNGGFQAAAFNVFFNDFGTQQTGDIIQDRRSLLNERTSAAQHRIFLNDPDISIYPSGSLGQYNLVPTYLACKNGSGCVSASVTEPGQIDVLIDFDTSNGPFIYDEGTADVVIAFKVDPLPGESPPYNRCIPWDGKDAFGNQVEDGDDIELLIRYTQGIYHFPIYDAEFFLNGFVPTTIRPFSNGSQVHLYYDDININAPSNISEPVADVFNGCDAPCHRWSNKDYGNLNTINTWYFATEQTVIGVDIEACPLVLANDTSQTSINQKINIPILNNDTEAAIINKEILALGVLNPQNGTVLFDTASGEAIYTPNNAFIGQDSFQYVACLDVIPNNALCDIATVYVDILPAQVENCANGFDDDGDGLPDCDDPDCLPATPGSIMRSNEKE